MNTDYNDHIFDERLKVALKKAKNKGFEGYIQAIIVANLGCKIEEADEVQVVSMAKRYYPKIFEALAVYTALHEELIRRGANPVEDPHLLMVKGSPAYLWNQGGEEC